MAAPVLKGLTPQKKPRMIIAENKFLLKADMRLSGFFLMILSAHGLLVHRRIKVDLPGCLANITSTPYCDTLDSTLARCSTLSRKDEVIACVCTQQLFSSIVGYALPMTGRTSSLESYPSRASEFKLTVKPQMQGRRTAMYPFRRPRLPVRSDGPGVAQ